MGLHLGGVIHQSRVDLQDSAGDGGIHIASSLHPHANSGPAQRHFNARSKIAAAGSGAGAD